MTYPCAVRENLVSLGTRLLWGMQQYGSIENYEIVTGEIAEPTTVSRGDGHSVAVEYSDFTPNRMVKWIRGSGDTKWFGVELL